MIKPKDWDEKTILNFTLIVLATIYLHYFVFLPQSWTLNNDYGWLLEWKAHRFPYWSQFFTLLREEMASGRFHPVFNLYYIFLYRFLPLIPVVFRICRILLLIVTCGALADVLTLLAFEPLQILFAEVLFLGNLTIKDWITLAASCESIAIICFLFSLSFYLRKKKLLAALLFIFSFLSKESFFVLLPTYFLLEYFDPPIVTRIRSRIGLQKIGNLAIFTVPTLAFVFFIAHLPRIYTAGRFDSLHVKTILIGFFVPPTKAFAPALLLGGISLLFRNKKFTTAEKKALSIGICIVLFQTLILGAWGSFDSWYYLHMAIPVGWAIILAVLWSPTTVKIPKPLNFSMTGLTCIYLIFLTLHGSNHLWLDLANARTAAEIACQDFEKNPTLKVYSNCEEGSAELHNYLITYGICKNPPQIIWTGSKEGGERPPTNYEILSSPKCNGPVFSETPKNELKLEYWKISRY